MVCLFILSWWWTTLVGSKRVDQKFLLCDFYRKTFLNLFVIDTYSASTLLITKPYWNIKWLQYIEHIIAPTDIHVEYDEPIPIYCDNTSTISISKNPVMHSKTNHIPIKYHFLQEQVAEKNIRVEYVGTKEQVADIFTKPLPREVFEYLRQRLGVISTPKMNAFWMLILYVLDVHKEAP